MHRMSHSTEGWSPLQAGRGRSTTAAVTRRSASTAGTRDAIVRCLVPRRTWCSTRLRRRPRQDDCASCHCGRAPGHADPRPCAACHTTRTRSGLHLPVGIVHPADYPVGGRAPADHVRGVATGTTWAAPSSPLDRECWSCHMSDYFSAPLVDHQALGLLDGLHRVPLGAGLPRRPVRPLHLISGGFELRGQHARDRVRHGLPQRPGRQRAHGSPTGTGRLRRLPPEPTTRTSTAAQGYPTDCLVCHNESTWDGAVFDHLAVSGFELVAPHVDLDCVFCHVGSSSETLFSPSSPEDCYACHQDDYQREHGGSGFSTDCTACHEPHTWSGATFNHSFPITAGPHAGRDCSECHQVQDDFTQFTCTTACHHTPSRTNDKHSDVNGYAYDSQSCLSCHPTGND